MKVGTSSIFGKQSTIFRQKTTKWKVQATPGKLKAVSSWINTIDSLQPLVVEKNSLNEENKENIFEFWLKTSFCKSEL